MEIALTDEVPVFAGGLGVLAGDYLRSAADLRHPIVGVSLLYRHGYFRQQVDPLQNQIELPVDWDPRAYMQPTDARIVVRIEERPVTVAAWRYEIEGATGGRVPVFFLDTDLPENHPHDRQLIDRLYGGGDDQRLRQEAILGLGGPPMLRRLGYEVTTYHMNEGHSSLLTLKLLEEAAGDRLPEITEADIAAARSRCVFTTHTPVPAGHDRFSAALTEQVLGSERAQLLADVGCLDGELNMSQLGLRLSRYANGVSLRHAEVARAMFPGERIGSITNGVHAATWTAPPMQEVFDRHLPGWRADNTLLRYASAIPLDEIDDAHRAAKASLVAEVASRAGVQFSPEALTIGLARRVTLYKRTMLLFRDLARLAALAKTGSGLQIVVSGKSHPRDERGKAVIGEVLRAAEQLAGAVPVAFVEDYDMTLAGLICAGSDVWLNTPLRPNEASGTSGMKAAMNGVPSLSILDGWWIEGWIEGVTGWAIGGDWSGNPSLGEGGLTAEEQAEAERHAAEEDAADLYGKLERVVMPLFYDDPAAYGAVRRAAISLNGSFFNTDRMVREYAATAYTYTAPAG